MAGETDLVSILPVGHSVGSIRSRRPVVYIFTGGNEDAALFTVNGFSLLLDGGDQKLIPYWNLIRNYDKISAVVASRMSSHCLNGISTIFARKLQEECHPTIGAFIGNLPPRSVAAGESDVAHMVKTIYDGLHAEGVKPNEALASPKMEPITLYEVIGEGALRMIVLNPERGNKELSALANAIKSGENIEKYAVMTSLAALFVWHPADTNKPTIRILYPGACPLEKLYAALEKLKSEEYLRHVEYAFADREKYASTMSVNSRNVHAPTIAPRLTNHKPPTASRPTTATTTTTTATTAKKPSKAGAAPSTHPTTTRTTSAAHTTTSTKTVTKTVVETAAKKVTKQPLTGAALSRMSGGAAPKKSSPTKPTVGGSTKSASSDAKSAPMRKPGAKAKEEPKKEKPAVPEPSPAPAPTPAPVVEPPKPEDHTMTPQHDIEPEPQLEVEPEPKPKEQPEPEPQPETEPEPKLKEQSEPKPQPEFEPEAQPEEQPGSEPEHEPKEQPELEPEREKSASPPPAEKQPTPPPPPQNLDSNGLLDGIEEPMKLRKISMDTGKGLDAESAAKLIAAEEEAQHEMMDNSQSLMDSTQKSETEDVDLLDMSAHGNCEVAHHIPEAVAGAEQDVPLLDSTPDMPIAPHIQQQHSPVSPQSQENASSGHLVAPHVIEQSSHTEELLGSGACPFTAGLVSSIVDGATAESALRKISAPPAMIHTKGDDVMMMKPTDLDLKLANGSTTMASPKLTQRSVPGSSLPDSLTSPASRDSVNAQSDAALDDVIESLAGESEREDHPKGIVSPEEEHDGKQNGGPNHMDAQHAMEDADAQELYMPPVTGGPRMRAGATATRPSFGGSVAKPKISQPLYFDVVFVPHHGAHPALVDEAAAKAFAISVRSKRYVLSGKDSIKPYILDGLIAAKTVWNKPELEIDVVPTYDADDLRAYNQLKAGEMSEAGVNFRCSVERCTLRLSSGDSDDVCAAFKFEM